MKAAPVKLFIGILACFPAASVIARDCDFEWSAWMQPGIDGEVRRLLAFDDGSGPALYAAGAFSHANGVSASNIARLKDSQWQAVGNGLNSMVNAVVPYDFGDGERLIAAGNFGLFGNTNVAQWNGQAWQAPPPGLPTAWIAGLGVFQDQLFVSGAFFFPGSSYCIRWDGSQWAGVGSGLASVVWDLKTYDDGSGACLAVAGIPFVQGVPGTWGLAKWTGSQWQAFGGGVAGGEGRAIAVSGSGPGAAMYVGGGFTTAGGQPALRVARWMNGQWSSMGPGFNNMVRALAFFDDGSGPALYAGGDFTMSGTVPVNHLAKWNGAAWEPVGDGLTGGIVNALCVFDDDGDGPLPPALYAGGDFTAAGGSPSPGVARWGRCAPRPCQGDIAADGVVDVDDLFMVINGWGPCADPRACPADLSGDGAVDVDDLFAVINAWGACP